MVPVNYWAVLVCGIVAMIIGYLWYGPLFGKQWVASMGWSQERMQEAMKNASSLGYLWMFVGALVMAFVLAHAVIFADTYLASTGAVAGAMVGLVCWVGFVAPSSVGGVLWEQKPWKWWFILNGYYLVTLVVMGIIFAVWM
jgi:Protein of unknown function (DUF1761)